MRSIEGQYTAAVLLGDVPHYAVSAMAHEIAQMLIRHMRDSV